MPFCPECRSEFRPGFTRCEECGVELIPELPAAAPAPPPPSNPAFHTVFRTTELSEALAITSLLEGHGIEATLDNQFSGLLAIGLPTPAAPIVVAVPTPDAAEAEKLVAGAVKADSFRAPAAPGQRMLWWVAIALLILPFLLLILLR